MLVSRLIGFQSYLDIWQKMQEFTAKRIASTQDELWLLEHFPVFTQGQAGKIEHVLNPGTIPVIQTDRGGQVTYHGPGQLVAYPLFDLRRAKIGVKQFVNLLEQTVVNLLADYGISSNARSDAPGIYVNGKKICSIGLKIRRGCSYHGIALNVSMDLEPFSRINPCGFKNLHMSQIKDYVKDITIDDAAERIVKHFTWIGE